MKRKSIRNTCEELFLYGFTEDEVADIFNFNPKTVNHYLLIFERECLKQIRSLTARSNERQKYYKDLIKQGMFSVEELDYGTTGPSKYKVTELSPQERNIK